MQHIGVEMDEPSINESLIRQLLSNARRRADDSPEIARWCRQLEYTLTIGRDEIRSAERLVDELVADYGSVLPSDSWWIELHNGDIRSVEALMTYEDLLDIGSDSAWLQAAAWGRRIVIQALKPNTEPRSH